LAVFIIIKTNIGLQLEQEFFLKKTIKIGVDSKCHH
jgi:hypothetical protein